MSCDSVPSPFASFSNTELPKDPGQDVLGGRFSGDFTEGVQGFVQVHLAAHGAAQSKSFKRLVDITPEITDAWTMTGDADYLLRVYCADLSDLNRLIQDVLLQHPSVARVHSQIVMDQLKTDGPLPT